MKRAMVWVGLAALVAVGCGKKDDGAEAQGTPKPGAAPAVACDKGQIHDGTKCVAVVTPDAVAAVKGQVSKLDEIEGKLDKLGELTAVIELVNAIRQLDVWKKASATSSKFKKVDEMVDTLQQGSEELAAFNTQLKASKAKLADLGGTLQELYDGSGAARTLADARAQVSTELRAAVEPLQAQVTEAVKAIEPALTELAKLGDIIGGVCAMGSLYGGGAEFDTLCKTGKEAFATALAFLEANKDAPKTMLLELVGQLESQLGALIDAEAARLLDQAQAAVDSAVNE